MDQAYAQVAGDALGAPTSILRQYRQDHDNVVSIDWFAGLVNDYIERQAPGFRLNFFVDEVGQYIADDVKLMTNLQSVAESLATQCRGRSWIVVTAQEDMSSVLGEMQPEEGDDFSKIQDRFKTRLKLTSRNVDEVIQKRLLLKTTDAKLALGDVYERERHNLGHALPVHGWGGRISRCPKPGRIRRLLSFYDLPVLPFSAGHSGSVATRCF